VAQLSTGVNIPNLCTGIIWHSFGNERKTEQRIGRMLRLNPEETATVHLLKSVMWMPSSANNVVKRPHD